MKRRLTSALLCMLLCALLCPQPARAEEPAAFFDDAERDAIGRIVRTYDSPTLKYVMEKMKMEGEICYLTRIWVKDPASQIRKATSPWKKDVAYPDRIVKQIPETVLAINGSGFVSPLYPWIPEDYPGVSKDYHYTPLGSVTVTDGEVLRNLEGVRYYGLTLDDDGLQMYVGEDNEKVLATNPRQTWSFYIQCPMMLDNEDILPRDWPFADRGAARTVIARQDRNNYLILTVTKQRGKGLTLRRVVDFFRDNFRTEWVYNLDGGDSTALMCRKQGKKNLRLVIDRGARIVDIMAFVE